MHRMRRSAGRRLAAAALLAGIALLPADVGAAMSASAPAAVTGPVSAVGASSATVTGTVNPGGQATTWFVEYGTGTGYGSRTQAANAGSGTASVAVNAPLVGLRPASTYHYRLVATNGAGTSRGADGIFTTASAPAAVTGAATDVTATSATLNGTVDPNGRPTTWYVEYGTSTSYGSRTPSKSAGSGTSQMNVAAAVSGLAAGRPYHYRLVATSDAGTSHGADRTFTTGAAPTSVTGAASSVTPTSATLNGTITPNGRSTSWFFEYGTSTRYGSRTSSRDAGSGTAAVNVSSALRSLRTGSIYHYRLVARNDLGTSAGRDQTFGTAFPPVARTASARSVTATTATLQGSVEPAGRPTTWYFEYGTTIAYGSRTAAMNAGSGTGRRDVAVSVSSLASGTTYHFRLVATSDAGTGRGADVTFTTAGVSLTVSTLQLVYGRGAVTLSGTVSSRRAGEQVAVLGRRYDESSFRTLATVTTGNGGTWGFVASPGIGSTYAARWNDATSAAIAVGVRPRIAFRALTRGRFSVRVLATRSFAGRFVKLQRRTSRGVWVTVRRARLNLSSARIFRATLPRGRSALRVVMSVNQAGAGYLGGISRTIVVRRR
jgi:hypothetical protein